MRHPVGSSIVFCFSIFLSGCGIGGMWMNGNPFPAPIKPYLENWEKKGVTPEERRDDSFACGGSRDDRKPFSRGNEATLMLPGETIWDTYTRLGNAWANCMRAKGYVVATNKS
ncbi:MAG: hypothetical protein K2Y13_15545 [Burkholderiaceae bacterium]|nr:hypothetical protein [Burkholderiaceae bacterium]